MRRIGPGRVRLKLAQMLAEKLAADGYDVVFNPETLYPATGWWRTDSRADCFRWEGSFMRRFTPDGNWLQCSIASWRPMTECLKGFEYHWDKPYSLEVSPT